MITAAVFAGGLGLASYQAGAYQSFSEKGLPLDWISGSSAGAVTAALIAGNSNDKRLGSLETFWMMEADTPPIMNHPFRQLHAWGSVARSHIMGSDGFFYPRLPSLDPTHFRSMYDLAPMRDRLKLLIDFGRLNGGDIRVTIAATDVETGDPNFFDTKDGPIEMDHLLASCGFLPEFAPVEIGGRMWVDGGLSLNAPFDPILRSDDPVRLFIVDLFARDGKRPRTLMAAAERKSDLMFGNQTVLRLRDQIELRALRRQLGQIDPQFADQIYLLSYRAGPEEPGSEKSYNFSLDGRATRWRAGRDDMTFALLSEATEASGVTIVRRAEQA
jgi:NTE family protein